MYKISKQSGFTLVEILVSTALFVTVVSAMLTLFTSALQINRRVQATRELVDGVRSFTDILTREIRNGKISYDPDDPNCNQTNYTVSDNTSLRLSTVTGDIECFHFNGTNQYVVERTTYAGSSTGVLFDSTRFRIIPNTFRIIVNPRTVPSDSTGVQPSVTIVAQFELVANPGSTELLNFETTISTDNYDIPAYVN